MDAQRFRHTQLTDSKANLTNSRYFETITNPLISNIKFEHRTQSLIRPGSG